MDVGLDIIWSFGALLFVCGVVCMASKRNAIGVLIGVELVQRRQYQLRRLRVLQSDLRD